MSDESTVDRFWDCVNAGVLMCAMTISMIAFVILSPLLVPFALLGWIGLRVSRWRKAR